MDINVTSPRAVRELMDRQKIAPLKRYGQNFLTDANIADKIAQAAAGKGSCVLEIGAGLGALTVRLAKRAKRVVSYEIDSGLVRALGETAGHIANVTVIHNDFLKADIEADLSQLLEGDICVAANLPYYITTDCIMKLFTVRLPIKSIIVMVQKEFAQRLLAPPGSDGYGALNAVAGYLSEAKALFDVPASCFFPMPDVCSTVIRLDMRGVDNDTAKAYIEVVRRMFAAKRKTVKNNIRSGYSLSQSEADSLLEYAGIDENARAQSLSVKDFLKLYEKLKLSDKI